MMQIPDSFFSDFKQKQEAKLIAELVEKAEFNYESLCVSYYDTELVWDDFLQQENELEIIISSLSNLFPEILSYVIEEMDAASPFYFYLNTRLFLKLKQFDLLKALISKLDYDNYLQLQGFFDALLHESPEPETKIYEILSDDDDVPPPILEIFFFITNQITVLKLVNNRNLAYASRYNCPAKEVKLHLNEIFDDLSVIELMYAARNGNDTYTILEILPLLLKKNKWFYLVFALLKENDFLAQYWEKGERCLELKIALALAGIPANYRLLLSSLKDNHSLSTAKALSLLSGIQDKSWQRIEENIPEDELLPDEKDKDIKFIREYEELNTGYEYWLAIGNKADFWQNMNSLRFGKTIKNVSPAQLLQKPMPNCLRYYFLYDYEIKDISPVLLIKKQKKYTGGVL
jgi:hypothetical protein